MRKLIITPEGEQSIDLTAEEIAQIEREGIQMQAQLDAQAYARKRVAEYPAMGDQLDYIFHNGVAKWKTDIIAPIKLKYPKPN